MSIDIEKADPDLIVFEDRTEKLFAIPQPSLGPFAVGNVRKDSRGGVN
jgi:hypothetical protein